MGTQEFLESLSAKVDESLGAYFKEMNDYHTKKHWYELGECILKLLREESLYSQPICLIQFYHQYISNIENKLLENTASDIGYMLSAAISDPSAALQILKSVSSKMKSKEASQKCRLSNGFVYLRTKHLESVKDIIDSVGDELDIFGDISQLHGLYFKLSADYYQTMNNYTKYYEMQLKFMSCAPSAVLYGGKYFQSVIDVSMSAILSPDIINLQEWLQHRAVQELVGTPYDWMRDLMLCITEGDLQVFTDMAEQWFSRNSYLAMSHVVIRLKLSLNALTKLAFAPHSSNFFSFEEISEGTGVGVDEVEYLVMKGLSKNMIGGYIDQVRGRVYIEWAYPRVCSPAEVLHMKDSVMYWAGRLSGMADNLELSAAPILQPFF